MSKNVDKPPLICYYNQRRQDIWSHRLTVRTSGSHPGNPGSIPGEITILEKSAETSFGAFLFNL